MNDADTTEYLAQQLSSHTLNFTREQCIGKPTHQVLDIIVLAHSRLLASMIFQLEGEEKSLLRFHNMVHKNADEAAKAYAILIKNKEGE